MSEQVRLTEILPDKKYVVVMPGARKETALLFRQRFLELLQEERGGVLVVSGTEVAIVPADQVVGYTALEPKEA